MSQHRACDGHFNAQPARRVLGWLYGAGFLVTLAVQSSACAEDSRFKFPSLFKKPEAQKAEPQQPSALPSSTTRRDVTEDRVLSRARQLLADAHREEAQGRLENALDLAARADGVYRAAQRTTNARWPSNEQVPSEYVRELESKLLKRAASQTPNTPAASVSVGMLPTQPKAASLTESLATANGIASSMTNNAAANQTGAKTNRAPSLTDAALDALSSNSDFGKTQRPDESNRTETRPAEAARTEAASALANSLLPAPNKVVENITTRGRQFLDTADSIRQVANEVIAPDQPLDDVAEQAPSKSPVSKINESLQTARNVLDQLDHLPSWQPVAGEKPSRERSTEAQEPPLPNGDVSESRSRRLPDLIGTPNGIEDDQVNPIPTHLQVNPLSPLNAGSGPIEVSQPSDPAALPGRFPLGMPLPPESGNVRADAQLMPAITPSETNVDSNSKAATTPLWLIGTIQAAATFVGVLGALLVVLWLRPKSKAAVAAVPATTDAASNAPVFAAVSSTESHDADSHSAPTTIPFRRAETELTPVNADLVAKSVFEQNLALLDELNHLNVKKAA